MTNPEIASQVRFANWLAGAIAEARGQPLPAQRKRWSPKDLQALHEGQISLFADLRAKLHSMEDVRLLAELAISASAQARRDKPLANRYIGLAAAFEALSSQLLRALEAQEKMLNRRKD